MFEKYTKGVLRNIKDTEDYSLLKIACVVDGKDRFTLDQSQFSKKFQKKISHPCDYFFRVVTYIYNERSIL